MMFENSYRSFNFYCLRHHGGHDPQAAKVGFVISILVEGEIDTERANRTGVHKKGHADKRDVALVEILAPADAVEEHWLATDLRHHDGFARLHDLAGDTLAEPIMRTASRIP
jgi:hypothetical protein